RYEELELKYFGFDYYANYEKNSILISDFRGRKNNKDALRYLQDNRKMDCGNHDIPILFLHTMNDDPDTSSYNGFVPINMNKLETPEKKKNYENISKKVNAVPRAAIDHTELSDLADCSILTDTDIETNDDIEVDTGTYSEKKIISTDSHPQANEQFNLTNLLQEPKQRVLTDYFSPTHAGKNHDIRHSDDCEDIEETDKIRNRRRKRINNDSDEDDEVVEKYTITKKLKN
ncbi:908_t:CDS:2, partial [Racocetra persica]